MFEANIDIELLMQMFGQMFGAIDGTVLSAGAPECKHQIGKSAFDVARHMSVGQSIDMLEER